MTRSTFEVVMGSEWVSRGSVVFPGLPPVRDLELTQLRPGYYPCFGVKFKPELVVNNPVPGYTVFWWDGSGIEHLTHPPQVPSAPRRLMLKIVHNPTENEAAMLRTEIDKFITSDASGITGDYTPHVRMDDDFVGALNQNLVFEEISSDLLRSNAVTLSKLKIWGRDGKHVKDEIGNVKVEFEIRHVEDARFGDVMMTRAKWSNGYTSLYGCCRA